MMKKIYLPLFIVAGTLSFSTLSPNFTLKADTLNTTSNDTSQALLQNIPWQSDMDASWLDPSKPIIALTFDDGPVWSGSSASDILDTLEAYNAHATFFYCGANINETTQSEIARSFALGNEIGNHTMSHLDLTGMDADKILYEINSTADLLSDITGLDNFLVRTPYCSSNDTIFNTIPVPLISAALDSQDYNGLSTEEIVDRVLSQADDGAIILMHEPLSTTSEAIKIIVPELIKRGYQLASVSEMMQAKGITMTSGNIYTYAPTHTTVKAVLNGATISYAVASEWPGNYMSEISITNTGTTPLSNWSLDFDFPDDISAVYGGTLKSCENGHVTITSGQWSQTINPGESVTFSLAVTGKTCVPKTPSNLTLTVGDDTLVNNPMDTPDDSDTNNNNDNINTDTDDDNTNTDNDDDDNINTNTDDDDNINTDTDNDDNDITQDNPTTSNLSVSSNLNSWGTGYTCTIKVTNTSDTPVMTWLLKVLKSDFDITNYWNCSITEDGDYLMISPASYNATIPSGGSVEFGIQGNGAGNPDFVVEIL